MGSKSLRNVGMLDMLEEMQIRSLLKLFRLSSTQEGIGRGLCRAVFLKSGQCGYLLGINFRDCCKLRNLNGICLVFACNFSFF